jgi:hypothetical protein
LYIYGNYVVIWYIFPRFGTLCQEKSGNPGPNATYIVASVNAPKTRDKIMAKNGATGPAELGSMLCSQFSAIFFQFSEKTNCVFQG